MFNLKKLLAVVAIFLFFNSCVNQNTITVVSRNFDTEIDQQQNLIFTFNQEMVNDSLVNRWDTAQLIQFSPPIKGLFKWNSKNELMFSPENTFGPATYYKAEITGKVLEGKDSYQFKEPLVFEFHTPLLKMENLHAHWNIATQDNNAIKLLAKIQFNYPVIGDNLINKIQVKVDGQVKNFTVLPSGMTEEIVLQINDVEFKRSQQINLEVAAQKGLVVKGSNYATTEILTLKTEVALPDRLSIINAQGEYQAAQTVIHVYTNQAVDMNKVNTFINIQPKVNMTVEQANDGFIIKGSFDPGQVYQLSIAAGLKGMIGGTLDQIYTVMVPFGEMQPSISFLNNGMYLSDKSSKNIGISIVNVPKIKLSVYKVYENNILSYMRQNSYEGYSEDEEEFSSSTQYTTYGMEQYGDLVMERTYETKNLPKVNNMQLLNLSMNEINAYKGIYVVSVASENDYWLRSTKVIALSDIGLIAKFSSSELTVFANSIYSALPEQGVTINCISTNNQLLFSGITDVDGKITFQNIQSRTGNFVPGMITSRKGNDFNMMVLNESKVNTSRFETGGFRENPTGVMAFMFGDRDLYRPGETVHLCGIVRNSKWMPVAEAPVKLKIMLPNGHELKSLRTTANKQGALSMDFTLPSNAVTGYYHVDLFASNDVLLGSRTVQVEEFMPDRIDVKVKLNKNVYDVSDTIITEISALNFFGPPAANRNYETEFGLVRKSFFSKQFAGYNFSVKTENDLPLDKKVEQGQTNEKGMASARFIIPDSCRNAGVLQGKIYTTVFDETGRPVNRLNVFDVFTQSKFYGIKLSDYYANRGSNMNIAVAACNKNGTGVSTKAYIEVINYDYYNVVEKADNGQYRYVSQKREVVMLSRDIQIDAAGSQISFIPTASGEYEVRVSPFKGAGYVSASFWSYGYGYTTNTSFNIQTEGQIAIQADKDTFAPGDQAHILFKTPFAGKMLVTVESNKLLKYFYLQTDKRSAMLNLPIEEEYLPNVYITATLFKPLDNGANPLTVAHGFMPLVVTKPGLKIPLSIISPQSSGSRTTQTIRVRSVANAEVAIAVVDEGILALKGFETPKPYEFFYQKRALQTNTYDVYAKLLPDLRFKSSSPGGDGFDLARRVNPLSNKRVQLVALWSGILKTNAAGEASFDVKIPQFSGQLRVMACSWKDNLFGSAEQFIKVADPVVISPSIPRFLSPNDTLLMPVVFTNTTTSNQNCLISCLTSDMLKVDGQSSFNVTLPAGGEYSHLWKIVTQPGTGLADIMINATSGKTTYSDKTEITIRPASSLVKETNSGVLSSGNHSIDIPGGFVTNTSEMKLLISASPLVQFSDQLGYLLDYPHGCLEQTVSTAFPQLYYSDLAKTISNKKANAYNAVFNVQEAIRKIEGLQIYNGSLTYWPGVVTENWWATTYALHFLTEAQKAGYAVNENTLNRTFDYLKNKVKTRPTEVCYFLNKDNKIEKQVRVSREEIYSLYVLALNGMQDISSMNYYKANSAMLCLSSRYMLAAAYLAIGDRKSYLALLPESYTGEKAIQSSGGNFSSYISDYAITLNSLLETDPDNPQIAPMARTLSQQIKNEKWLNTQERSFSLLALGKFMQKNNKGPVTGSVYSQGKLVADFAGKDLVITDKKYVGQKIEVKVSGQGSLYYFSEASGIKNNVPVAEEDSKLRIRRSYFNRQGQPLKNEFKQGDLIVVQLSLSSVNGIDVDNVVITDLLPSGFEIENPRITDDREMLWNKDKSTPDYFDIRDDRINFYTRAGKSTKNFYYTVRAVNTGNFVLGPASADAMYDGEFHSYHGGGRVVIRK